MDLDPNRNVGCTDLSGKSDSVPAAPAIVATPAVTRPGAEVTTGPEPAAQRRPSTPLLRRQPNMLVTDPTPLAPPPSPIPNISQYLGSDDDSLSSDATLRLRSAKRQCSVHIVVRLLCHRAIRGRRLMLMPMR